MKNPSYIQGDYIAQLSLLAAGYFKSLKHLSTKQFSDYAAIVFVVIFQLNEKHFASAGNFLMRTPKVSPITPAISFIDFLDTILFSGMS
jgi:hypothetical protein